MRISSSQDMFEYGKNLAKTDQVLLIYGDLGAGKTTLIKGFAMGLGINPDIVQSPTYAYVNVYDQKLLHIDMYRLSSFDELVEKGILNQISEFDYVAIEWPKWENKLDLDNFLSLDILKISAEEREIKKRNI